VFLLGFFWQNTTDLSDLVSSARDRSAEEVAFAEEYILKGSAFRAERFVSLCQSPCAIHHL
jgi:hypothetical protein